MIRNKKKLSTISTALAVVFLSQIFFPTVSYALTGGPSQPEVETFEPIGTNQMVDPFSGDFTYNIPLLDVGGYPVNISYHSGVTMDQEASWVGLGWNINPGVINRNLRGLPDDFNGDQVTSEFNMKMNQTFSLNANFGAEIFGMSTHKLFGGGFSFGLGMNYNTYTGMGMDISLGANPTISFLKKSGEYWGTAGLGLGVKSSSDDGLTVSPKISFSGRIKTGEESNFDVGANYGISMNSRKGVTNSSFGMDASFNNAWYSKPGSGADDFRYGTSTSFVPNTYIPQQEFPFENGSFSASIKFGATIFGLDGTLDMIGGYSYQRLKEKSRTAPSYGYMNIHNGSGKDNAMLDFNREKDGAFTRHRTNLPVTNLTHDLFGISGHGIGGMFRAHRNDIGHVHDIKVNNNSVSGNAGVELAGAMIAKFGADAHYNGVSSETGQWQSKNAARGGLLFKKGNLASLYEPSHFKIVGERNVDALSLADKSEFWKNAVKSNRPLRVKLDGNGYNVSAGSNYVFKDGTTSSISPIQRLGRAKRNQLISTLNKEEVANGMGIGSYVSSHAKDHHIAEVSVLRTDGSRYIYGLPAYNFTQKDATFNVTEWAKDCATGLVEYDSKTASKNNERGVDQYYQSTSTPAYAHSYLLTSLLGSDYSDYDNVQGPSDGDFGSWVKFDYSKISNYKWRVPFQDFKATYNEGLKSIASDEKGSYMYGEKELFYLNTIESKTHVAVFHTSDRADAHGVVNEHGGGLGAAMKKLDKISLYTKAEYLAHIGNLSNAVPVKEVHFEYDYSLCGNLPNNTGQAILLNGSNINAAKGKLTLKKVYFTYANSYKAKFSAYEFSYADLDHDGNLDAAANPAYNLKSYDRWGHYKPNINTGCGISDGITAAEYPYVEQDKALADVYQSAWNLTDISLPSGGTIEIFYEADDYAYVQDKKAMQMFKVLGTGEAGTLQEFNSRSNELYDKDYNHSHNFIYFKLQETIPHGSSTDLLKERYIGDVRDNRLYFRFLVNLNDYYANGNFDYISGYAELDATDTYGYIDEGAGTPYQYAYVKLKEVQKGDDKDDPEDTNPISRAAWSFARAYNPKLAYNSTKDHLDTKPGEFEIEDVFLSLYDSFANFIEIFKGPNQHMQDQEYGRKFVADKSWIRLYNPNGKKLGGGVRVHKLVMKDSWDSMTSSGQPAEYGQVYSYDLEDGTSSGVASYEPLGGGDENPWRLPIVFSEEKDGLLIPDQEHYIEGPMGESFFPSAGVGYSRVEIKNLQYSNVTQHAAGKVVHEFYTAKDFPILVDETPIKVKTEAPNWAGKMFKLKTKEHLTASQGYVVETNDMHGKPKAQWVYAENNPKYLTGAEYKYKTKTITRDQTVSGPSDPQDEVLDNYVDVLFKDNTILSRELGVDYDMVHDFRKSYTKAEGGGLNFNMASFLAGILPWAIPTVIPSYSKSETEYKAAVTTKVVSRYAIQDESIAYDQHSVIRTKNLLWDAETGQVILSRVENEYDDNVYSFSYPAHLAYSAMGNAYQNIGYEQSSILPQEGYFTSQGAVGWGIFHNGDEVMVLNDNDPNNILIEKAWIMTDWVESIEANAHFLVDKSGALLVDNAAPTRTYAFPHGESVTIKILRSGYENRAGTSIGQISSKANPIQSNALTIGSTTSYDPQILTASAVEYKEEWQTNAEPNPLPLESPYFDVVYPVNVCTPLPGSELSDIYNAYENLLNKLVDNNYLTGGSFNINLNTSTATLISTSEIDVLKTALKSWYPQGSNGDLYLTISSSSYGGVGTSPFRTGTLFTFDFNNGGTYHNFWEFLVMATKPTTGNFIIDIHDIQIPQFGIGHTTVDLAQAQYNHASGPTSSTTTGFWMYDNPGENNRGFEDLFWLENCALVDNGPLGYVNPYVAGIRGNWRPFKSHSYLNDRKYSTNLELRTDGTFFNFDPFWQTSSSGNDWTKSESLWTAANQVTKYNESSVETENEDALGIYSGVSWTYSNNLTSAVAGNARFGQFAFDGFEDYSHSLPGAALKDYISLKSHIGLSSVEAHTGSHSMEVPISDTAVEYRMNYDTSPCNAGADQVPYLFKDCDQLGTFGSFESSENTTFLISYWVKEESSTILNDYNDLSMVVEFTDNNSSITSISVGPGDNSKVIEGWQKREARITLPGTSVGTLTIDFVNGNSTNKYYVDDFRIQPILSSMKSFVYDYQNLRFIAELDENNFATFYEYDEEGALVRVKKETERGIMTIQENRNHSAKP